MMLVRREEGRDEETSLVQKKNYFKLLHQREEFFDVAGLQYLCEVLHQHETCNQAV